MHALFRSVGVVRAIVVGLDSARAHAVRVRVRRVRDARGRRAVRAVPERDETGRSRDQDRLRLGLRAGTRVRTREIRWAGARRVQDVLRRGAGRVREVVAGRAGGDAGERGGGGEARARRRRRGRVARAPEDARRRSIDRSRAGVGVEEISGVCVSLFVVCSRRRSFARRRVSRFVSRLVSRGSGSPIVGFAKRRAFSGAFAASTSRRVRTSRRGRRAIDAPARRESDRADDARADRARGRARASRPSRRIEFNESNSTRIRREFGRRAASASARERRARDMGCAQGTLTQRRGA